MTLNACYTSVMDAQHEEIRITLRIPADVADGMKQSAHENDRSLNGEIVRALREYLAKRKRGKQS
jgi:hypothetical protein